MIVSLDGARALIFRPLESPDPQRNATPTPPHRQRPERFAAAWTPPSAHRLPARPVRRSRRVVFLPTPVPWRYVPRLQPHASRRPSPSAAWAQPWLFGPACGFSWRASAAVWVLTWFASPWYVLF